MQGEKKFKPKLFQNFRIDEFVPATIIYKTISSKLDFNSILGYKYG